MPRLLWSSYFRFPACILVFILGYLASTRLPIISDWSNGRLVLSVFSEISAGRFENVSKPEFAYALASAIVSVAAGVAIVFLVLHVLFVRLSLMIAQRSIAKSSGHAEFKLHFAEISDEIRKDPLIGDAWDAYSRMAIKVGGKNDPIYMSVRPQTYLNIGLARERLSGLKILSTVPGYFVGVGLLLTFIGLVIALSKAAGATSGDAKDMTASLNQLLNAATFKFSTSIAGLFSSIVLSILFKMYSISIESGFDKLCWLIESRVVFMAPQQIAYRAWQTSTEQLHQLKEINDVQFFQRLGAAVSPVLETAVKNAISPLTAKLDNTVDKLENANRVGVEGLVDRFTESIQGTAGKELRELAIVLGEMKEALKSVQGGLSGSGEDFSRRMMDLAENFGRLINEATSQFTSAKANASKEIATVGSEAATAVQEALQEVLAKVSGQMGTFQGSLVDFQDRVGRETALFAASSREAAAASVDAASRAAVTSADQIRENLVGITADLRGDLERMAQALKSSEAALNSQAQSIRDTTRESNASASAFERVAKEVHSASAPLTQAAERIASATQTMSEIFGTAVQSLSASQVAARDLAERLTTHHKQIESVLESYEARFGGVDESLSKAVAVLAEETTKQQENITRFVVQIDEGCAKAVTSLQGIANNLAQNTEDLGETLDNLLGKMRAVAAE
jgi:hypothetical protein